MNSSSHKRKSYIWECHGSCVAVNSIASCVLLKITAHARYPNDGSSRRLVLDMEQNANVSCGRQTHTFFSMRPVYCKMVTWHVPLSCSGLPHVIMSNCMLIVPQVGLWMLSFTHPLVVERMHSSIVIAHRPTFRWSEVETIVFTTTTHPYIPSQQSFFIVSPPPTLTLVHFTAINQLWCHWTWLIQCLLCYVALKPSLDPCKSLQLSMPQLIHKHHWLGPEKT